MTMVTLPVMLPVLLPLVYNNGGLKSMGISRKFRDEFGLGKRAGKGENELKVNLADYLFFNCQ